MERQQRELSWHTEEPEPLGGLHPTAKTGIIIINHDKGDTDYRKIYLNSFSHSFMILECLLSR